MSVGFYSTEDAKQRTGKSEEELIKMAKSGALNTVEDGDALWFSAADIDDIRTSPKASGQGAATEKGEAGVEQTAEAPIDITEVPIALEPEQAGDGEGMSKIQSFGGKGISALKAGHDTSKLKRKVLTFGEGATRCRTFHSKLNDPSLANLDERINEWLDQNENMVIKFATSTVGVIEGKHAEPHLIVTVFY